MFRVSKKKQIGKSEACLMFKKMVPLKFCKYYHEILSFDDFIES